MIIAVGDRALGSVRLCLLRIGGVFRFAPSLGRNRGTGVECSDVPTGLLVLATTLLVTASAAGSPDLRADCIDYGQYPHWIGEVELSSGLRGVDVADGVAVVCSEYGALTTIDVSSPTRPAVLSTVQARRGMRAVAIAPPYAFICGGRSFQVIDISVPSQPDSFPAIARCGSAVALQGEYAYTCGPGCSFAVINVADPTFPEGVGSCDVGNSQDVAVQGNYAYVAESSYLGGSLKIVDITVASSPQVVKSVSIPGAVCITLSGGMAYVGGQGIRVVDITVPLDAHVESEVSVGADVLDIAIQGRSLVAACDFNGLRIVDISDPTQPRMTGYVDADGISVAIDGQHAFVADYSGKVRSVFLGDAPVPTLGEVAVANPRAVKVTGGRAYVATNTGLQTVDLTSAPEPVVVDSLLTSGSPYAVDVASGYVYLADFNAGLEVISAAEDGGVTLVRTVATPGYAEDVVIRGKRAYVADFDAGLQVVDIANPAAATILGSADTPGYALAIAVDERYCYIADAASSSGLQVIDVSQPNAPERVSSVPIPDEALDVALNGHYAYVAASDSGLQVVDVANPRAPVATQLLKLRHPCSYVAAAGDYVYALARRDYSVIDVSDPAAPKVVGGRQMAPALGTSVGWRSDLIVSGSSLYLVGHNRTFMEILPAQCGGVTPVLLAHFAATAEPGGIRIQWTVPPDVRFSGFLIERSEAGGDHPAPYSVLNSEAPIPGYGPWEFVDTEVSQGISYAYRLVALSGVGEDRITFGPILATAASDQPPLGAGPYPNPVRSGLVTISCRGLGTPLESMTVYDTAGRCVRHLSAQGLAREADFIVWDTRDQTGRRVSQGSYFVRLTGGRHTSDARVTVIR